MYLLSQPNVEDAAHKWLLYKGVVGVDLETTGVDPFLDKPLLMGIGDDIVPMNHPKLDLRPLYSVIESRDVIKAFHHLSFDSQFFLQAGVFPARCICTMLGAMLLKVGIHSPKGTFSLGNLLQKCLQVSHDKTLQTSFVGANPVTFRSTEAQRDYLSRDVDSLPALVQYLARRLQPVGLMETWKLENSYAPVIAMMHIHGVPLDVPSYMPDLEKAETDFDRLEGEVSTYLTPHIMEVRRRRFERDREAMEEWQGAYGIQKAANRDIVYGPGVPSGTKAQLTTFNALNKDWQTDHKKPNAPKTNDRPILVTSGAQVKAALVEMGIDVKDTKKDTLYIARAGRDATAQAVLALLGDLSEVKKIRSNEGREMLGRLRPLDGSSEWGLLTTRFGQLQATGRLSSASFKDGSRCRACGTQNPIIVDEDEDDEEAQETEEVVSKPNCIGCGVPLKAIRWGSNMQNLTERIRRNCRPLPGRRFVIADYGQVELRVAAELVLRADPRADDAVVRAFRDGIDPHSDMAAGITGESLAAFLTRLKSGDPEAASLRYAGKTTNFSATYGVGPNKLASDIYIARKSTGLFSKAQVTEAAGFLELYWRRNPTLRKVLDRAGEEALSQGWVATLGGRRRYFEFPPMMPNWMRDGIKRQGGSHLIQGTAADIVKVAQNELYRLIAEFDRATFIFAAVHDEVCLNCAEEDAELWKNIVRQTCEDAFYKYITHVKCELACEVQTSWMH